MNFLYTAYAATWIIHIAYLATLVRRYQRLNREIEEMKKVEAASNWQLAISQTWLLGFGSCQLLLCPISPLESEHGSSLLIWGE